MCRGLDARAAHVRHQRDVVFRRRGLRMGAVPEHAGERDSNRSEKQRDPDPRLHEQRGHPDDPDHDDDERHL